MKAPLTVEQWSAAQALRENKPPTSARVAACLGIDATTLSHRATQEGWATLNFRVPQLGAAYRHMVDLGERRNRGEVLPVIDYRALMPLLIEPGYGAGGEDLIAGTMSVEPPSELYDLPPGERATRVRLMLTRRIEAVLSRAEAGGQVEAKQVAAIGALAQLADRIAPSALDPEVARRESAIERDKRVAAALERVNARILYLSKAFAVDVLVDGGMAREEAEAKVATLP